jgi:hypothetical protein
MSLLVRAFPVVCDRREVEKFAAEMRSRADDVRRFYESFGVKRESWFYQDTPHGALVISVTDVADVETAGKEYAQTTEHFAAWFKNRVKELSGIDPNEQPLGPPTEMIFDSSGADLPDGIAISARIYPARSREAVMEFADQLRSRSAETTSFYEGFGVPRETWFLQETPSGPIIIGVTAMKEPERVQEYAETKESFAAWFKQRVEEVTGVDPNKTPLGPPSEQVFEFEL